MSSDNVPDFGKKKKKPKNPLAVAPEPPKEVAAPPPAATTEDVEKLNDDFANTQFLETKKKKKKIVDVAKQLEENAVLVPVEEAQTDEASAPASKAQELYPYEELLERIFMQLRANNPELATEEKKKLKLPPPLMARVGTKKTQFTNFTIISKSLNRDPAHLSAYLFAELGTTGSIDSNGALMIRGKYMSKHIEPLLQSYARNYVKCNTCNSYDTRLEKDARLLFLICNKCSSKVTVKTVTSGFQAVTDKRAAIRAKAQ